jgi:hypothetical protein
MSVRTYDPKRAEILGPGRCACRKAILAGGTWICLETWTRWCRGCNLVYCGAHANPKHHGCPVLDKVIGKSTRFTKDNEEWLGGQGIMLIKGVWR